MIDELIITITQPSWYIIAIPLHAFNMEFKSILCLLLHFTPCTSRKHNSSRNHIAKCCCKILIAPIYIYIYLYHIMLSFS